MSAEQKEWWAEFLSAVASVAETARIGDDSSVRHALSLSSETLQRHLDVCGSAITNKFGAFLKRLFLSDSLKTESVNSSDKTSSRAPDSMLQTLIK